MYSPLFYKKMQDEQKKILQENFKFYKGLSLKRQRIFEHRVKRFIDHHEFIGKEDLVITQKMLLLIAGTAIMLSFGFKHYLYALFTTILVYPEDYYSSITHKQHKGETNPAYGVVVFSWEDFKAGLAIENDNIHLGLHEFTHALHFSFEFKKSQEGRRFLTNFQKILYYLKDRSVQRKLIDTGYIRSYAFENQYEFLAVLVEHFFETPEQFKKELPTIFGLMLEVLQLNKLY